VRIGINYNQTILPVMRLLKNDIHIWRANVDLPRKAIESLNRTLSIDEINRAEEYHFDYDRNCFIVRRGVLRTILSHYLSVAPSTLRFCYGRNGKPALASGFGEDNIHFNLAHSNGIALYAFTQDHEIGIDIEQIRKISEMDQIVGNLFSEGENAVFRELPESKKMEAFMNCWVRKEAFVKAIGDGLSFPLDSFEVSLVPGEPARLLKMEWSSKECCQWFLQELRPAPGYVAALALL